MNYPKPIKITAISAAKYLAVPGYGRVQVEGELRDYQFELIRETLLMPINIQPIFAGIIYSAGGDEPPAKVDAEHGIITFKARSGKDWFATMRDNLSINELSALKIDMPPAQEHTFTFHTAGTKVKPGIFESLNFIKTFFKKK